MSKVRHQVAGVFIMGALISLLVLAWGQIVNDYEVVEEANINGENVMESLNNLNLIEGINELTLGIQKITAPSSTFDLLGGLASAGIGTLQTVGGIIELPIVFFRILFGTSTQSGYYPGVFPPIVATIVGGLVTIYVLFIILSAYLKFEV